MPQEKIIKIGVDAKDGIEQVDKLKKGVKDTSSAAEGSKGSFSKMKSGVQGLGVAFKALGIGLIVAAFVKLKDLFSGNIETARHFERAAAKLGAAFDVVRDRLEPLFMGLMKAFTEPQEAIKSLWSALKTNILNRIEGLIMQFKALGKVIKGVFTLDMEMIKEGATEAGDAFVQMATGMDEAQRESFKEGFRSITKEIREETKAVDGLTVALQRVRDSERDMLLVRAKANKIIAESRLLAEDDTKSMKERLEALTAAVAEEKRVADIEMAIQRDKVNALQGIIDLGKSSEEDIQKLAEERARLIELQTASVLKQKRVAAEIGSFTNQIAKEEERVEKERLTRIDLITKAKELNLEVTEELTNKEIAALIKAEEKRLEIERKAIETQKRLDEKAAADAIALKEKEEAEKLAIQKARIEASKALTIGATQNILSTVGRLAGEGTKTAKAAALAGILIDTAKGISGAIAAGAGVPFPANLGAIATGVASVLAGIANAKGIFAKVGGGDDNVDTPTSVDTGSAGAGGMGALIPNIENIEQPTLGGTDQASIQAYVIENDISNAQALQQELDTQATL